MHTDQHFEYEPPSSDSTFTRILERTTGGAALEDAIRLAIEKRLYVVMDRGYIIQALELQVRTLKDSLAIGRDAERDALAKLLSLVIHAAISLDHNILGLVEYHLRSLDELLQSTPADGAVREASHE